MASVTVEVAQINLQHSRGATANFCRLASVLQTNIALIHEPWLFKDQVRGLGGLKGSLYYCRIGKPRACIWAGNGITSFPLPQLTCSDLVAISVQYRVGGRYKKAIFASAYLPYDPRVMPPTPELRRVINYCSNNNLDLIVGCDANSHHTVWGSTDINNRGVALLEYLGTTNLIVINQGVAPTFVTANRSEVIDITIASSGIAGKLGQWRVSSEESLSDHRLITFKIEADPPESLPKRNPRRTDWNCFHAQVSASIVVPRTVRTPEGIEQTVEHLNGCLTAAYQTACPTSSVPRTQNPPWWTRELEKLRSAARRKYRRVRHPRATPADWEEYRRSQNKYRKALASAKKKSWHKFVQGVQGPRPIATLYKVLSRDKKSLLGALEIAPGEYTDSEGGTLSHLLEVHFPGSRPNMPERDFPEPASYNDWRIACNIVNYGGVGWAIGTFKPYKSPGPDGVVPAMLQHGGTSVRTCLLLIYRACLALGYVPKAWRQATAIFIPKPGKGNYAQAKSFRPISLTSFCLKGLEKLVERYIRDRILNIYPLHPNQHAYQTGKSTDSALHELVSRVERSMDRKEFALASFLDIAGAFDNVSFRSMEEALVSRNVNRSIVLWIKKLLSSRRVTATLGGVTREIIVAKGCPQGGVLSPLLWNLVVDDILVLLNGQGTFAQGYADDICLVLTGSCLSTVSNLMQTALDKVDNWCQAKQLRLQPNKTELILFTNRRKLDGFVAPAVAGVELQLANQVKYLGIILDSKLSWQKHGEFVYRKAISCLWQCRQIVGKTHGINPKAARWLYTAIVRPIISYGAVVWWTGLRTQTMKDRLGKIQRLACLLVTGAMNTTPTAALECILNFPPLNIYVQGVALATYHRLRYCGLWGKHYTTHCEIVKYGGRVLMMRLPSDGIVPQVKVFKAYKTVIPLRAGWKRQNSLSLGPICIYTDGSKTNQGVGAGVYISTNSKGLPAGSASYPLGKLATVFQAEVYAILISAQKLLEHNVSNTTIKIFSDSQGAIKALKSHSIRSKLILDCHQALNAAAGMGNNIHLIWVPGHAGIAGNEQADAAARQASSQPFNGPEPVIGISVISANYHVGLWVRNLHEEHWHDYNGCRQTKLFVPSPYNSKQAGNLLKLNRRLLRITVGLLTGHCGLNKHLTNMQISTNKYCQLCEEEEETPEHLLLGCEELSLLRFRLFGAVYPDPVVIAKSSLGTIIKFIKLSGRFANYF